MELGGVDFFAKNNQDKSPVELVVLNPFADDIIQYFCESNVNMNWLQGRII